MDAPKRIVIAEDHTILREALSGLLCSNGSYEVVGEATDGLEIIRCINRLEPDLLLTDLSMPRMNGTDAIREVERRFPRIKILVLTMHNTDDQVLAAFEAGADGYVLKDDTHRELLIAIDTVLKGKSYLSPGISRRVIKGFLEGKKAVLKNCAYGTDNLTHREREILKLIAEGYRNKDIAEHLCVSTKTVEKHRANLRKKLDLHSTLAMARYAREKGLTLR